MFCIKYNLGYLVGVVKIPNISKGNIIYTKFVSKLVSINPITLHCPVIYSETVKITFEGSDVYFIFLG